MRIWMRRRNMDGPEGVEGIVGDAFGWEFSSGNSLKMENLYKVRPPFDS